jgi:hypothetical protein
LWSTGCIFAGLLFNRDPFIKGKDNDEQVREEVFRFVFVYVYA